MSEQARESHHDKNPVARRSQEEGPESKGEAIRVIVADDHPIVRSGIVSVLGEDARFNIVAEAANGLEAAALSAELKPDLLLTDLRMPGLSGDEVTEQVRQTSPQTKVVVLTTYENDDSILSAIEAGASGYLLKAAPAAEILAGLHSVLSGEIVLSPQVAAALATQRIRQKNRPTLSKRELEVLGLVAQGNSNQAIAEALFISEATVKTHLIRIFDKLGVNDRTRAVTLAMEHKLI